MAPRKRSAPEPAEGGRRRSGRISSTPKKSNYFEDTEEEAEAEARESPKKRGRPAKKARVEEKAPVGDESDDYRDEEDEAVQEDEDEDEDEEVDEDAPMKKTIIPLEKMRDTGGVEYEDERVHNNTMLFLRDLKANNKRSWLKCKCHFPIPRILTAPC